MSESDAQRPAPACHPDRRHKARGLCGPCYEADLKARKEGGNFTPEWRSVNKNRAPRKCKGCDETFEAPASSLQRFHSTGCRTAFWKARRRAVCKTCGDEYERPPVRSQTSSYCKPECYWEGRRGTGQGWLTPQGYRMISMGKHRSSVFEHRWMAEQVLGRPLRPHPEEEVHHRNGNRSDNWTDGPFAINDEGRLVSGNFEVWSTRQPKGQEIGPKLDWAFEMLEDYLPMLDDDRRERLQDLARRSAYLYGQSNAGERPANTPTEESA